VSSTVLRVKKDDWGDINATQIYYSVPVPLTDGRLRPLSPSHRTVIERD
jgi:hypothetical protein